MPTLRTVTVKSAAGDYSSLSAAEAGEQADLPTLDRQTDIECYSMNDTTATTITGWTTDATRYVRVYTPSAERHAGLWNGSKYNLTTVASRPIDNREDFVRCEGLQLRTTAGGDVVSFRSTLTAAGADVRLDSCILRGGEILLTSGVNAIRNCVQYRNGAAGMTVSGGTANVDNCTFAANTTYGINRTGGTVNLQNVYSGGNGTDDYNGTITRTTCAHSSATSFSGSTASIAHDTSNFTNVTSGSEDYHLVGGASATLLTGGTDLSGTFTTDIDGETRSDWSIGADEIVGAPSGQPTWKRFGGVVFAARGMQGVW